jgi:hypothetical protein
VVTKHAKWCQDALATLFSSFSNSLRGLVVAASRALWVKVILEQVELRIACLLLRNLKVLITLAQLICFINHKSIQILGSLYLQN